VRGDSIHVRPLRSDELERVEEIDRSERIGAIYVQRGMSLEIREGDFSAPAWDRDGTGEYSVAGQRAALEALVAGGAVALGAFDDGRLVGIGAAVTRIRPEVAQLAYLHVSREARGRGIGARLSDELEAIAREAGVTSMVVSATPSVSTVDFYRRRGYEPMAEPLPELVELEPEDVHLLKSI
jgi:GNAT superfamily N-acetyltransferase